MSTTFEMLMLISSSAMLAQAASNKKTADAYATIGKEWLRVAEGYRRTSVYTTLSTAHLVLSALCWVVSWILTLLTNKIDYALPSLVAFLVFVVFAFFIFLRRYGYPKAHWFEKFSLEVVESLYSPLLHHLVRWKEVEDLIETSGDYRKFLESLPDNADLRRLFGYTRSMKIRDRTRKWLKTESSD